MAKLSRLSICGIRSFGPLDEDTQDIKFMRPVTLILGENGCGKTTIIEALKYACTGDYPEGSGNGKGFIQEPKLSRSAITKGFVKLKIIDSRGKNIIINRGAKVELGAGGKLKLTKMDSSISTTNLEGKQEPLSGRCADISENIYNIMSVSKPILNNVIFCHQEHSLWPLDEDSQVKKKFDEIFDATKYNKCIDEFRKYIKAEKEKLRNLKEELRNKQEKKDWAEKRKADLQKNENKLIELISNIDTKENEIKPITEEIQKICELENVLTDFRAKLTEKRTQKEALVKSRQSILAKLDEEFKGNDNELDEAIKNFEKNKSEDIIQIENFDQEINKIDKNLTTITIQIQKLQVRLGQLETEKKQQCERIDDRNKQIEILSEQLKVTPSFESESEVEDTIKNITETVKDFEFKLNTERENNHLDEKRQQREIDNHRENIAKLEQQKNLNSVQKEEVQNKQRSTSSQLKQLDESDDLLKTMNNKIEHINRQIKYLLESYDPHVLENRIKKTRSDIEILEKDLESLEKDDSVLQKNYATEENIVTRTSDIKKKESKVCELKNTNYRNFKLLFNEVPHIDIKNAVEKRRKESADELEDIKIKIDEEKEKITSNETSIRINTEKLVLYEKKVDETNKKVSKLTQNGSFDQTCLDLERSIEKLQKSRGQFSSAKIMYEKFVKDFQSEKPCCPVCETDFTNKESIVSKIITKIKQKIDGLPQELERIESELKKKQEIFNQVQQLKPQYKEAQELEESLIPKLKSEISEAKDILNTSENNLKKLSSKIETPKQIIDTATKIAGDATLIDKYNAEIDTYKREIDNLKLKLIPVNSNKSREQVQRDLKVRREDISEKRKMCDADAKKLENNRKEHQELRDQKSELEREKLNLEKAMHGKPQLLEQLTHLEEEEQKLDCDTSKIEEELLPLREMLENSTQKLESSKAKNEEKYKYNMQEFNQTKRTLEDIVKNQKAIETFIEKKIDEQLKTLLENFTSCKNNEKSLNIKKKENSDKIMQFKENQAKAEIKKRNLEDNVEIRKKLKEIETLENSVQKLTNEIGTYNHTSLQKKKQQLQTQQMTLIKEISNINGQKDMLETTITSSRSELEKRENKEAYNIYLKKLYELETKTLTIKDAEIYSKGLEDAIIQFHKEKMSKINATIRELWRSVYKGNDIDYIQVKTEQPENITSSKRTYNYRVVQIKNDIEIDMRGRCSAGQKVLACLLIRMALAMTFSHNCGILALDEPTTNLDRENIQSLCDALANMIRSRRLEKNFQLLVITHDEEFIKSLSLSESIEYCLRVKRNKDGNTVVAREHVH